MEQEVDIETANQEIEIETPGISPSGTTNHASLSNLNYESSGHTGFQATISDLDTIRTGASKGMTAIQEHQSLANYSLIAETGNKIDLSIDNSTYIMTLVLKDKNNNALSTGTIDLPLETMVVGATYDNVNKKIVLTLKNGQTLDVPVGDLVNGLATQTALNEEITNRQNADNLKENIFRYSTMPTASASNVGNIVEYIGITDSNYTKGYFYENINTEVQESITASQTDNGVPLGTITLNNNTLKSQLNAGTHEFYYRPYDTVLNFMNINEFPPASYQVTRDNTFDRQPMFAGAPKMYSWVDGNNNFYVTDTLQPNALTKLYLLDIRTNETTDTGATFIGSNTPSQIEGRWTKKTGYVYEDVEISDYGILLSSSGLPGNTIQVVYTPYSNTYSWQQKNVQPSSSGGTSDFDELTNRPSYNGTAMTHTTNIPEVKTATWDGKQDAITSSNKLSYNLLSDTPTIPTVDVNKSYVDTELAKKQNTIDNSNKLNSDLVDDTNSTNKFVTSSEKTTWDNKSTVSVSNTGMSTDEVQYITINGVEKKLPNVGKSNYLGTINDYTQANPLDLDELDIGDYFIYADNSFQNLYMKATLDGNVITGSFITSDEFLNKVPLYIHVIRKTSSITGQGYIGFISALYIQEGANSQIKETHIEIKLKSTGINTSSGYTKTIEPVTINLNQTISGKKTFTTLPESNIVPTTDDQLVNKKYVDDNYVRTVIKTTLDNVLEVNTQYYLGQQSTLALTLPSTANAGQIITVDFASGSTAASLTITGNVAGDITYTPEANKLVEINFKFDGTYWKMLVSSVDIPSE